MPPITTSLPNPAIWEGKPVLTIKMNGICNQEAAHFQEWPAGSARLIPHPALPAPFHHQLWVLCSAEVPYDVRDLTSLSPSVLFSCLLVSEKSSLCLGIFLLLVLTNLCLSDKTHSAFIGTAMES